MYRLAIVWAIPFLLLYSYASAQSNTEPELPVKALHSPHKATVYSAILPGLGQVYNKKYWKVPIVYAGYGTITYFALLNQGEYRLAKEAYIYVSNKETYPTTNKYAKRYSASDLLFIRDYYRRNTELSWILLGLWHVLNIVDATVDAHFFYYDISDNISLQLQPATPLQAMPFSPEFAHLSQSQILTLKFRF